MSLLVKEVQWVKRESPRARPGVLVLQITAQVEGAFGTLMAKWYLHDKEVEIVLVEENERLVWENQTFNLEPVFRKREVWHCIGKKRSRFRKDLGNFLTSKGLMVNDNLAQQAERVLLRIEKQLRRHEITQVVEIVSLLSQLETWTEKSRIIKEMGEELSRKTKEAKEALEREVKQRLSKESLKLLLQHPSKEIRVRAMGLMEQTNQGAEKVVSVTPRG